MATQKEHLKTLMKLNVFALGVMHVANRVIGSLSSGKNMLKPVNGKYYQWQYGDIFYHKYGKGSPLLLLHDLNPENSAFEWDEVIEDLSENHTLYVIDLPGCGRSAKPNISYTNYLYVLFLNRFINDVIKQQTDIIADGYSSSFVLMAALDKDSQIGYITAVNPHSFSDLIQPSDKKAVLAKNLIDSPIIGTNVYNMVMSRQNIDFRFTEEYLYNPFRSKQRFVDAFYEGSHFGESKGKYLLASFAGKYMSVDITKAVKEIGSRLTIFYGDNCENGEEIAKNYQKLNHDIKVKSIAKVKYLPSLERPEEFLAAYNIYK